MVLAVGRPSVVGVPPQLAVHRKGIGWAAGQHLRMARAVQSEQFGVAFNISAVGTTEDGQVANQFDVEAVCVLPQCLPLAIQDPLHKGVVFRLG